MTRSPVCVGGLALGAGYFWATIRRFDRPVPEELVAFHRKEQVQRLKKMFRLSARADQRSIQVKAS